MMKLGSSVLHSPHSTSSIGTKNLAAQDSRTKGLLYTYEHTAGYKFMRHVQDAHDLVDLCSDVNYYIRAPENSAPIVRPTTFGSAAMHQVHRQANLPIPNQST